MQQASRCCQSLWLQYLEILSLSTMGFEGIMAAGSGGWTIGFCVTCSWLMGANWYGLDDDLRNCKDLNWKNFATIWEKSWRWRDGCLDQKNDAIPSQLVSASYVVAPFQSGELLSPSAETCFCGQVLYGSYEEVSTRCTLLAKLLTLIVWNVGKS